MKRKMLITGARICGTYIAISAYFLREQKLQLNLHEKNYEVAEYGTLQTVEYSNVTFEEEEWL